MTTVLDSLVIQLGIDAKKFDEGQRDAIESFLKLRQEIVGQQKKIDEATRKSAEGFQTLKTRALTFVATLAGVAGIGAFVRSITVGDAALGRFASTLGLSAHDVAEWQGAAEQLGASGQDVAATFQSLSTQIQSWRATGESSIVPVLRTIATESGVAVDIMQPLPTLLLNLADASEKIKRTGGAARATYLLGLLPISPGMIPLLEQGRAAVQRAVQEQDKLTPTHEQIAAAQERLRLWTKARQELVETGREVITDFEPLLIGVLHILDAVAKATNNWSIGIDTVFALWTANKIVRLVTGLAQIRNAFLDVAAAETAAGTAAKGDALLALLGKFGVIGLGGYALAKTMNPTTANKGEDEAARQRAMAAQGLDPNGKPLGGGTMSKAQTIAAIRQIAAARGIDPDQAVRVAASEGLGKYIGDHGSSYGPFQLHYSGLAPGGNSVPGLGDEFTAETGLDSRNPATVLQQIIFSMDHAARHGWGAWHGWKGAPFAGIERMHRSISDSLAKIPSSASVSQLPFFARGGAAFYPTPPVSNYDHSTSSQATINTINVVTKGDVGSIAKGIGGAINRYALSGQANGGPR